MISNANSLIATIYFWFIYCQASLCYKDNCYFMGSEKMKWHDSKNYCNAKGGDLTSIHSKPEDLYVKFVCSTIPGSFDQCWIGLTDENRDRQWEWVDGSAYEYKNWGKGYPNNQPNSDYVRIYHGGWGDAGPGSHHYPVCKISKIPTTGTPTDSPTGTPTDSPTGIPTMPPTNLPTSIRTANPTAEPSNSPTARCCHIKPEWTRQLAAKNCPASSNKRFPVKACKKSFQKRLQESLANELYEGCESNCVYDYKMMAKGKGAFQYKQVEKCYVYAKKGECFKKKKYGEAMRQIANRLLKKDVC